MEKEQTANSEEGTDVGQPKLVADVQVTVGSQQSSDTASEEIEIFGNTSPGVLRMEKLREKITRRDRIFIFASLFIIAYVYGLDSTLRFIYQVRTTSTLPFMYSCADHNMVQIAPRNIRTPHSFDTRNAQCLPCCHGGGGTDNRCEDC